MQLAAQVLLVAAGKTVTTTRATAPVTKVKAEKSTLPGAVKGSVTKVDAGKDATAVTNSPGKK